MITSISESVGVIIGRFQVPAFTGAWKNMVSEVVNNHQFTAILLSSSPLPGNRDQPLNFLARRLMIQDSFPSAIILPLYDMSRQTKWVQRVESVIRDNFPLMTARIYGSPEMMEMYQSHGGRLPVTPLSGPPDVDAVAELQNARQILSNSIDFRRGVIFGTNHRFPHVISTVDGVVVKGEMALLGRKPNEDEWRFIGGFADLASDTDEEDMSREMQEEAGLHVKPEDWYYLGRYRVNDWRYRNTGDVIRTGFYIAFDFEGEPVAGDDIAEVRWVKITSDPKDIPMIAAHQHLWKRLQDARNSVYEQRTTQRALATAAAAVTLRQRVTDERAASDDDDELFPL